METSFFELGKGGKHILLLHGWGADKEKLRPLGKKLAKADWHVVALDLPGFGATPPPPVPYSVSEYASFIKSFAGVVFKEKPYIVFGHSFGGRIAIKLTLGDKNVSGVVLCSSSGFTRNSIAKRLFFLTLAKAGKILSVVPSVANAFRFILYKAAREHDYQKAAGVLRPALRRIVAEDMRPLAARLNVPALIVWGKEDRMTPIKGAYKAKHLIPRSLLKIYEDVGHALPYRRPAALAREITTWSKTFLQ